MPAISALLTNILAALESAVLGDVAKLIALWSVIFGSLPAAEAKTLVDAKAAFSKDVAAGKGLEEAAADAWTTFYTEEGQLVQSTGSKLFSAFLSAFGVPQA